MCFMCQQRPVLERERLPWSWGEQERMVSVCVYVCVVQRQLFGPTYHICMCMHSPHPSSLPTSVTANHGAYHFLPILSPSSAPSAAPEFSVTAVTATSITVTWQPLPPCEQNGDITNYTIAYRMEGGMDMSFNESVVNAPNLTDVVESLTPYTNYTIKMAASTSVGRGGFGPNVTVQTNESSEARIISLSLCL